MAVDAPAQAAVAELALIVREEIFPVAVRGVVACGPFHHDADRGDGQDGERQPAEAAACRLAVLAMGIYPKPFADVMNPSIQELLKHVAAGKL